MVYYCPNCKIELYKIPGHKIAAGYTVDGNENRHKYVCTKCNFVLWTGIGGQNLNEI